jgi:hypothetical protein
VSFQPWKLSVVSRRVNVASGRADGSRPFLNVRTQRLAMPSSVSATPHGDAPSPRIPGEMLRGIISVALCVYLFGVVLTVAGNSGSGSSALVRNIKARIFSPWMVPLWLDLGFDERLTYGQLDDAQHVLELAAWPGGENASTVRFPAITATGVGATRWRTLAAWLEPGRMDEDLTGLLQTSIATAAFSDLGTEDLRVRSLRVGMPERATFPIMSPENAWDEASAARVRRIAGGVQLLPVEAPRDLAPIVPLQSSPPASATPVGATTR